MKSKEKCVPALDCRPSILHCNSALGPGHFSFIPSPLQQWTIVTLCLCHWVSMFPTLGSALILMLHFLEILQWKWGSQWTTSPTSSSGAEANEEEAGVKTAVKTIISPFSPVEQGLITLSTEIKQKTQIQLKRSQKQVRHKKCSRNPTIDFFFLLTDKWSCQYCR